MRYPLFLDLTGQPVTVIGAGQVAARKIKTLLKAGATITVISPKAGRLPKGIRWIRRTYRRGDLAGARLVVAATDNLLVNEAVCREAKRRRQLVNCSAPPAAGNFIVPALIHRGGITLAISTGGASPAFAKRLRCDLECFLAAGYPALLRKMSKQR
ncbi:MAG: bifunctional precorrin-2 dehydrogenase/sirohydrochlorin ferrochelatase [Verrucomicrobiota bacterium]